jgi:hypothetical protein
MKISETDKKTFVEQLYDLFEIEQIFEMNQYIQHGNTSTLTHSLVVSYYSYIVSLHLPLKFDTRSVIRGAMLHDFYLYDWHIPDKSHKLHGYKHPNFALINARKYFTLNPVEEDIIAKHMWPLTLRKPPLCREAMLVCLVDKYCSFMETFYIPYMPKELRQLKRMIIRKGFVY